MNAVSGHMKELVTRDDPKPPRRVRTPAGRDYYGLEIGDVITPEAAARAKARNRQVTGKVEPRMWWLIGGGMAAGSVVALVTIILSNLPA